MAGFNVEAARAEGYSEAEIAEHLLDINQADRGDASDADVINTLAPVSAAPMEQVEQVASNQEGVASPLGTGLIAASVPAMLQGAGALKDKMFSGAERAAAAPVETPKVNVKGLEVGNVSPHGFNEDIAGIAEYNKEQSLAHDLKMGRDSAKTVKAPPAGFEIKGNSRILSPIGTYQTPAEAAKMRLDMENSTLGNRVKSGAARTVKGIPGAVGNTPAFAKIGMGGYNAQDAWNNVQQDNPVRATVASTGTLGSLASLLSKNPRTKALGAGISMAAPAINRAIDYFNPPEHKAGGGKIGALTELAKPVIKKLSEALGDVGAEGKNLAATQADRTIVGKGQKGGPGFSGLQHTDPEHAAANAAWAVGKQEPATMMVNANKRDPAGGLIWTNYVGSPNQHVSNPMVLGEMWDEFMRAAKEGKLTPEQLKKMNTRLSSDVKGNLFDKSVDITDPKFLDIANTFEKRRLAGDVIGGEGVGGAKGRIIPYDDILNSYTDPAFIGQPTGVIGNRLFTLDNTITHNPRIHEGFPYVLGGKDLKVQYAPVPSQTAMRDFVAGKLKQKAEKGVKPEMGTYDWIRGTPIQPVTEDYLTFLQKEGYAGGGKVDDAKKFQLSTGALEDLFGGYITPSQFPAAAKHDLTHFPKVDKKSVNDMSKELAMNYGPMSLGHLAPALMGTIKNVGGQWLPTAQREVEKQLGNLSKTRVPNQFLPTYTDTNKAVNNWANTTGRKYVLNRLGSSEDEIKKLYDQGITHIDPAEMTRRFQNQRGNENFMPATVKSRVHGGFPEGNTATTEAGKTWENVTDSSIYPGEAKFFQHPDMSSPEWIKNLDPNTPLHRTAGFVTDLPNIIGMDKLSAALEKDIASGKLRPEQLNKVSMEDAVRRAHQQQVEAQAASEKAAQSIPRVREYPEGYAWHDLTHEDPKMLETILKKEGETMQNCIGGYCEDVLEGGTKLYSLRDAKGEPHVNVEVRQSEDGPIMRQVMGKQNEAPSKDYLPFARDFAMNPVGEAPYSSIWSADELGLIDANKLRTHGIAGNSMGPYYGELDRIFPSEFGVLAGPHGVKIPSTDMLRMATENIPGKYVTQEDVLNHLMSLEARPMEQSYSKFYERSE